MQPALAEQKQALRKTCRQLRRELGEEARRLASQSICAHLAAWDVFQRADVILTYMPIKAEVDLTPLLADFPQKRWVVPRIVEADHSMTFHIYDPARMLVHAFGMAEPAPDLPTVFPADVTLALVPGLAFDRYGWRLGYGGGYFDRFLAAFGGISIGITFHALLLDSVPRGEFDIPMRWLATEKGLVSTGV